jgi:hypothetical protein
MKLKLKSFKPENTESTTNSAMVLTITPRVAMRVMMLMALLLLLESRYLRAM